MEQELLFYDLSLESYHVMKFHMHLYIFIHLLKSKGYHSQLLTVCSLNIYCVMQVPPIT